MKPFKHFKGVYCYEKGRKKILYTLNLAPGKQVYGEWLKKEKGAEYREWDPNHSKLGAALTKGVSQIGIKPDCFVLYLGVASGTTASHVSDIIGRDGFLLGVDFAPRVLRDFVFVCNDRKNIAPLLADAMHPETYKEFMPEKADVVFQDIAQKNQVEIFLKNLDYYLKPGGFGLLALKARSVDVTKKPKEIFRKVRQELEKRVVIVDYKELDPFEKDHAFFVVKMK